MRCPVCKKQFKPKRKSSQFCSHVCAGKATAAKRGQTGQVTHTCKQCGKQFEEYISNKRTYCSEECGHKSQRTVRPKCKICGEPVRHMHNRYCSRACRGKDSHAQRRGITSYSGLYARLKKMYPNPGPCVLCGEMGEHRHHPDYQKPYEIIWLCASCHQRLHPKNRKVRTKPICIPR